MQHQYIKSTYFIDSLNLKDINVPGLSHTKYSLSI